MFQTRQIIVILFFSFVKQVLLLPFVLVPVIPALVLEKCLLLEPCWGLRVSGATREREAGLAAVPMRVAGGIVLLRLGDVGRRFAD